MLFLQLFLIFAATPFMILTAVVEDRKLAGEQLARLSGRLIEAHEEERKRIARDVHDDYRQRVAMLAIDVESLTEKVGNSSIETKQELLDFYQRISELGADMHSLSPIAFFHTRKSGAGCGCKSFLRGVRIHRAHSSGFRARERSEWYPGRCGALPFSDRPGRASKCETAWWCRQGKYSY
jgi:hypothetical protein